MIDRLFDIHEVQWENYGEGIRACVFKASPNGIIQYWEIQPGIGAASHSHPAEQITYVQSGVMRLWIDGRAYDMTAGCFAHIPSGAVHQTENIGSGILVNVDFFLPDRADRTESPKIKDLGHHWDD